MIKSIYYLFKNEKLFVWKQKQKNVINVLKLTLIFNLDFNIFKLFQKSEKNYIDYKC